MAELECQLDLLAPLFVGSLILDGDFLRVLVPQGSRIGERLAVFTKELIGGPALPISQAIQVVRLIALGALSALEPKTYLFADITFWRDFPRLFVLQLDFLLV